MSDPLDSFIAEWDVRERHTKEIQAPAELVYEVVRELDMQSVPPVRLILGLREKLMRAGSRERAPQPFIDELRGLGWAPLLEMPGELLIHGAVCQPWLPDVVFTPVPPERFSAFAEPDQVKIAWTLEVESRGQGLTGLATETRAVATDEESRARFRRYWRWARAGIVPIRWFLLSAIRREAERRWRQHTR